MDRIKKEMVTPGQATDEYSTLEYQYMPRQLIWHDMVATSDMNTPQAGIGLQMAE